MTDQELERLAWERLDGTLSPTDARALDRLLATEPAAAERLRQIEELELLLQGPGEVEPPPEVRVGIDRALAATRPRWARRKAPAPLVPAQVWPLRLAFLAAGVLLGGVVAVLLLSGPRGIVSGDRATATIGITSTGRVLVLDLGHDRGTLALQRRGGEVEVDLTLAREEEVQLELRVARGGLRLEGADHEGGATSRVHVSGDVLEARVGGTGEHRFTVRLGDAGAPLDAEARGGGRRLAAGRIEADGGGAAR